MKHIVNIFILIFRPVIFITGLIGLPKRKFTGEEYFKYRDKINVGHILLTKTHYELSNLINPCKIKHGAVYVGNVLDTDVKYVLESIGDGVVLTDLVTFLLTKDVVICVEYKNTIKNSLNKLNNYILDIKGSKYDYRFSDTNKNLYCFELCANFIKRFYPNSKLKTKQIFKKEIYDHNTFLDKNNFNIVFSFGEVS